MDKSDFFEKKRLNMQADTIILKYTNNNYYYL